MKRTILTMMLSLPLIITSCNEDDGISSASNERKDIVLSRTEQQMTDKNVTFAFSFFSKMNELETEKPNWMVSPLSASIALSMTANGTEGNSRNQIQEVLGFEDFQMEEVNAYNNRLADELMSLDNTTKFNLANSVWLHHEFNVYDSFIETNEEMYDAQVTSLDLTTPLALEAINNWSAEQTNNLIPEILDELPANLRFCFLNSLYFKGIWKERFKESATTDEIFTCADGKKSRVKMMKQKEVFLYCSNETFMLTKFPFGNEAFSMTVLLPNEGHTLEESLREFTAEYWTESMKMKGEELDVQFPRFELKYEVDLIDVMKGLGITEIFDEENADFLKMTPNNVFVNLFKQAAYIKADEEGAEAAATTIVGGMDSDSVFKTIDFHMNRPFAFLIEEESTGVILFMGKIEEL